MTRIRVEDLDPDDPLSARDAEWVEKIKKILDRPKHQPKEDKEERDAEAED